MKQTDFALLLSRYLSKYLPNEKASSPRTIDSYRVTFILLLEYMEETEAIPPEKLTIESFTKKTVTGFLDWLEQKRGNSTSTRNARLAAIKGFVHYLKYEYPEYLDKYQLILGIPIKKAEQKEISYLKTDGMKLLVEQIDLTNLNGLRDYVLLLILYTTGVRVSELINIRVKDLSLSEPYTLVIHGKGNKGRYVPLMKSSIPYIKKYLTNMHYNEEARYDEYLFKNHMNEQLTRQGVNYILKKYGAMAREKDQKLIPRNLSPHKIRHTTAMELLSSGVDLMYIRDLLGHSSVVTTEIYARTDAKLKRKAIEAASKELLPSEEAAWDSDADLKKWLKSFNKR